MQPVKEMTAQPFDFSLPENHFKLAIVVSVFNEEVTEGLLASAHDRLNKVGFPKQQLTIVKVPGAVEIGIITQQLATSKHYAAIICLGAVIRGETSHYDFVCQQVSYACQKVALETCIPVIFGILTTETEAQALARVSKGAEAIDTALAMISLLKLIAAQATQKM